MKEEIAVRNGKKTVLRSVLLSNMQKIQIMITQESINRIAYQILGCAIRIHKALGPGLLESAYKACFMYELKKTGLRFQTELRVPIIWGDAELETDYRLDILVEDLIVVELKATEGILPVHEAQLLTYMRLIDNQKGF